MLYVPLLLLLSFLLGDYLVQLLLCIEGCRNEPQNTEGYTNNCRYEEVFVRTYETNRCISPVKVVGQMLPLPMDAMRAPLLTALPLLFSMALPALAPTNTYKTVPGRSPINANV